MDENHRQIAEDLFSSVSMNMTTTGKTIPLYIMILPGDQVLPIIVSDPEISIQQYATICTNIAHQQNAIAMMMVCEQFMVSKHKDDADIELLINGVIRASEHPDREEYLTLIYMDQDGVSESIIAKIYKDAAGTPFTRDFQWVKDSVTSMVLPWM